MALISALVTAFFFALACNLDTVLLAAGYGARGVRIPARHALVLAAITTVVTWLSLILGDLVAAAAPEAANMLGGLALVGIGCWFLLDFLRGKEGGGEDGPVQPGLAGWIALAAALAVNNAGVGVAAGAAGLSVPAATGVNFLLTLLCLPFGRWLGAGVAGRLLGRLALPLSGLLLVALGTWEALC